MASNFIELAEEFQTPRWSKGFWGSRFFGTTGGLLMDMLAEGAAAGLGGQYLYDFSPLPFDESFDQPLDALVSLGHDAMRPWYPGESHYASLRTRLRAKWAFWTGSPMEGLVDELQTGLETTAVKVKAPDMGYGQLEIEPSSSEPTAARGHPLPSYTLPLSQTKLKAVSIYVGGVHSSQVRVAVYQGGTVADSAGALLIRDFGQTSGSETDVWLTLFAANETIDPTKVLWVVFKAASGAELHFRSGVGPGNTDFDSVDGRRVFTSDLGSVVADPFPPALATQFDTGSSWYSMFITTGDEDGYWSRFWVTLPAGEHPITGVGALVGTMVVGTDTVGPAGLTPEYNQLLRSLARRYKPVQWVPWDFRFQLAAEEYINLQGLRRFEDPNYVYHQV